MNVQTLEEFLPLVSEFLTVIASLVPQLHLAGIASQILNAGAALINAGLAGSAQLTQLTEKLKTMVAAGQGHPTAAEFADLKAQSDAAHAIIQGTAGATSPPPVSRLAAALPTGVPAGNRGLPPLMSSLEKGSSAGAATGS